MGKEETWNIDWDAQESGKQELVGKQHEQVAIKNENI